MRRSILVILSVFVSIAEMGAQEIVLEKDVAKSALAGKRGVNQKSFGYLYGDYQVYPFGNSSDVTIEPFKSRSFSLGYKRIYRIANWYSLAGSMGFMNDSYTIAQNGGKVFPTPQLHKSERVYTYNIVPEFFQRFLLKKDYKHLGIYFDAGAYAAITFGSRHKMYDSDIDKTLNGKDQVNKVRGLSYISPFNYGLGFRLGMNRFAIVSRIRLSNWLKPSFGFGQPPAASAGMELSLY